MEEATDCPNKNIAARLKFAKEHLDVPQRYWQNILWTDETTAELFGRKTYNIMCGEQKVQHTSSQVKSMLEGASCFGAALLPQGLDSLPSSTEK